MSAPNSSPRFLLCLDFDLTMSKSHLFHYVVDAMKGGFSREKALLRAMHIMSKQGPKGGDELWKQLASFLTLGHGLAITSYTAFPELPITLLAQGIKPFRSLNAKAYTRWLSRPVIVYGDPAPTFNPPQEIPNTFLVSAYEQGKNMHIEKALQVFESRGEYFDQVILIDDDEHNLTEAKKMGVLTIPVCREPQSEREERSHLREFEQFIMSLSTST
ncbi:MAG: hypothetical protein CMH49_08415 [Myxococcales bacterium]|nr:hypothetical protein [Myxococcales bacterium]